MAVIKTLGLDVSVVINGKSVPEHDDLKPDLDLNRKHPGTKVVHKYIESEDDLEYSVRCKVLPDHRWLPNRKGNMLEFAVVIDGELQHTKCISFDAWDKKKGASTNVRGVPTYTDRHHGTLSRFTFSSVNAGEGRLFSRSREDFN